MHDVSVDSLLFIIPGGELEPWLKNLGCTGHGPTWLINVFEKMGEDPAKADYVRPQDGDVWRFLSEIKKKAYRFESERNPLLMCMKYFGGRQRCKGMG
jgi:hypothetical protein